MINFRHNNPCGWFEGKLKEKVKLMQIEAERHGERYRGPSAGMWPCGSSLLSSGSPVAGADTRTKQQKAEDLCLHSPESSLERFLLLSRFNIIYSCTFYCRCRHLKLTAGRSHGDKSTGFVVEAETKCSFGENKSNGETHICRFNQNKSYFTLSTENGLSMTWCGKLIQNY